MTHSVEVGRIDEYAGAGRLGRHVEHDERSRSFQVARVPVVSKTWARRVPIFDQGDLGSCTGNAAAGALGSDPFRVMLPVMNEAEAVKLYEEATALDAFPGGYPPEDTGSTGLAVAKACQQDGLISGYQHALGLDAALAALMAGPVITGVNWYDCIAPNARVLTPDLRWVQIQKLEPEDEIVGFDETNDLGGRCYRRARVVANDVVVKDAIRLDYEIDGKPFEMTVSAGHLFLVRNSSEVQEWRRADAMKIDDLIYSMFAPCEQDTSYDAGWLAGFFDGEGSVGIGSHTDRQIPRRSYRLDVAQKVGPTLDQCKALLAAAGFDFRVQQARRGHERNQDLDVLWLPGGRRELLRFLATIRPERLVTNANGLWENQSLRAKTAEWGRVTGIRRVGKEQLHAIGTTTGTLVVEGLLTHNSFDSPDSDGFVTISKNAGVRGGHEFVVRGVDVDKQRVHADNSWGLSWGNAGSFSFSFADWDRLLSEQGDVTLFVPNTQPAPTPVPVPVPVPPSDADAHLAPILHKLLKHRWHRMKTSELDEIATWLTVKGL